MKIDLILLSLRGKKGKLSLGRAFCSPAHAVSAGEGTVPALLWWKATLRVPGTAIYLETGLGNSAAATARVTVLHGLRRPTNGPPE